MLFLGLSMQATLTLKVTFNGSFDHVNIDSTSVQNLEIIEPMHTSLLGTNNKKRSLFQVLNTTRTFGGYANCLTNDLFCISLFYGVCWSGPFSNCAHLEAL